MAVVLLLFRQDYAYWGILFFTPLSINLDKLDFGFGIAVPTEPILLALLFFFLIKILQSKTKDYFLVKHPVGISILLYLSWMFITSLSSEMPLVSFKFLAAHLWFVIPLFFMAFPLFKKEKNILLFFWFSIGGLSIVVLYTTLMHAHYGFSEEVGRWIMSPFYNDHTAYGMALAFFLPITFGLVMWKKIGSWQRGIALGVSALFILAFYLSYSRAAWLSLVVGTFMVIILKFKIQFRYFLLMSLAALLLVFANMQSIKDYLEMNKTQSSRNFVEHVQSSSNVMSDASNLERINRWNCALRLFQERPVLGWGPGTYQFVYGPMQRSDERTIISTNSGDAGTAHSEYLGPLAESGFIGLIAILGVFLSLLSTGFKVYNQAKTKDIKYLALISTAALATYLSHGFLNNFLDTDKASVPFWTIAAILVALDWRNQQADNDNQELS